MKKYAVLTSNMQVAPANKHEARRESVKKFLPSLIDFLGVMRQKEIPVIHLQLAYDESDSRSKKPFGCYPPLVRGSDGVKLLPEMLQPNDIVIEKSRDSGFFNTDLDRVLKNLKVDSLIVTGMQAYSCVQFTAVDAFFRGYEVIVNCNAIGSTRDEDTEKAIKTMRKYCASVLESNQIYSLING